MAPLAVASVLGLVTGCGSNGPPGGTTPTGATTVVLMLSSTANDRLAQFDLSLASLSLTSQSGKTVSLFSAPPYSNAAPEFIHLNGSSEPFLTVSVPQDTYSAATATVSGGQLTCATVGSNGGLQTNIRNFAAVASNQVTVTLPAPIAVSSAPMALSLNLQVSQSATFPNCATALSPSYSVTPAFTLSALPFAVPNTGLADGEGTTVQGLVTAVDAAAGSFTVSSPDGPAWSIQTEADTTYQGVSGMSTLVAGTPVDMDIVFNTDGSIEAQRVEVLDSSPTNLSTATGPVFAAAASQSFLLMNGTQEQGFLRGLDYLPGTPPFSLGSAVFQISGYLSNLSKMPFTPSFTAANMVPGQNILVSSHAATVPNAPLYIPASTVTLMPQTVNGVVTGISRSGSGTESLTTYTVSLASYDAFTALAAQGNTPVTNPGTMLVYVYGANVGTQTVTAGSPFRFTGLVFNDGGALKMDCLQILAGVTE